MERRKEASRAYEPLFVTTGRRLPYLWLDATYLKVRQNGRILGSSPILVAVAIAMAVNVDSRREVLGMTDVVGIFPNEAAITRLVGAILLEQNNEWAVQRTRYMTLETIAPLRDDLALLLPTVDA